MAPIKTRARVALSGLAFLILILIASGIFNKTNERRQYRRYPQIGRSVDIAGRTLNIYCSGAGSPAVIFETFAHQAGFSWSPVQPLVAQFTHACWYDRAGFGWSDRGPSSPTFEATASDLHALLAAAQVPPPYLLVGANDAASMIRIYNHLHPGDVAAVLLIDGNDVDVYTHQIGANSPFQSTPEFIKGPNERWFGSWASSALKLGCTIATLPFPVGAVLPKFGSPRKTLSYGLPSRDQAELDFLSDRAYGDACFVAQNAATVQAAGNLGDRPLIVLASHPYETAKERQQWNDWWVQQEEPALSRLSTKGRLVVVDHRVGVEEIVESIRSLVQEFREPTSGVSHDKN